jgi:hypothetical protein
MTDFASALMQGMQMGNTLYNNIQDRPLKRAMMQQQIDSLQNKNEGTVDAGVLSPKLAGTRVPVASALPFLLAKQSSKNGGEEMPVGLRLKPGERWNPEHANVEAVPGSDLFIQQKQKYGKDTGAINSLNTKANLGISKVDELLAPGNAEGLANSFGGYNALLTRYMPTDKTAKARNTLESLKNNMKMAGLEMARAGGSIGAMTEAEWGIVEKQIDSLNPTLSEKDARLVLESIRDGFERIKADAQEAYDAKWSGTQYQRPTVSERQPQSINPPTQPRARALEPAPTARPSLDNIFGG